MIKAVIIDLDDTLCLTEAVSFEMENMSLGRIGRPPMARQLHIDTWGQPLFEVIAMRSPGVNVDAFRVAFQPIIAAYTQAGKLDAISNENYAALDKLLAMNKSLMILTSRTHSELKHLLEPHHALSSRVKTFYYRDTMQFHKPDPRAFTQLLAENDLPPTSAVYVGDSVGDAAAATGAGLHFIASLESGLRQKDDFVHYSVDAFIHRFPEVVAAVTAMGVI